MLKHNAPVTQIHPPFEAGPFYRVAGHRELTKSDACLGAAHLSQNLPETHMRLLFSLGWDA